MPEEPIAWVEQKTSETRRNHVEYAVKNMTARHTLIERVVVLDGNKWLDVLSCANASYSFS